MIRAIEILPANTNHYFKMDVLRNLQGEWEGNASRAYATRFGELRPGFVWPRAIDEMLLSLLFKLL